MWQAFERIPLVCGWVFSAPQAPVPAGVWSPLRPPIEENRWFLKVRLYEGGTQFVYRPMPTGKTWILVADHSRAQLYLNVGPGKHLQKLKDIASPPEHTPRHTDSHDGQDRRHDGELFAGQLCTLLLEGRTSHQFDRLILVASPKFLGQIRAKLDRPTHDLVTGSLDKDFMNLSDAKIQEHLSQSFFTF